jgi:membrane protein implicated in regulation of membrane protease activity
MNKKTNSLLFVLGGTLFNILITILSFIILWLIYAKFASPELQESTMGWILPILFVAAIIISFLAYRVVVKIIMQKVDMDKYFDPLFGQRRKFKKP